MAHVTIYSYGYPATSCMYKAGTAPTCDTEENKSIHALYTSITAHLKPTPRTTIRNASNCDWRIKQVLGILGINSQKGSVFSGDAGDLSTARTGQSPEIMRPDLEGHENCDRGCERLRAHNLLRACVF